MIVTALLLVAVGVADLIRQFVAPSRRWIGYAVAAVLLLVLGAVSGAALAALAAVVVAAGWVWGMPDGPAARRSFWPAVVFAVLCAIPVMLAGSRADAGLIGSVWHLRSPFGPVPFDLAMLVIGVVVFVLESGNVVVRAALAGEHSWRPGDVDPVHTAPRPASGSRVFAGGRLIGPLERILVLALTLAGAYALLAAMVAAKGIVRFPEISRDGETGARAEYFLVGSLVSWVSALGGALLVWWAAHAV